VLTVGKKCQTLLATKKKKRMREKKNREGKKEQGKGTHNSWPL
jgi:hypothetical protein